jgi:hypothetical protein
MFSNCYKYVKVMLGNLVVLAILGKIGATSTEFKPKTGIPSSGITPSNPGIESRRKKAGIPGLTPLI